MPNKEIAMSIIQKLIIEHENEIVLVNVMRSCVINCLVFLEIMNI